MVLEEGFEPPTRGPSTHRSTRLSYSSKLMAISAGLEPASFGRQPKVITHILRDQIIIFKIGAQGGIRTHTELFLRQLSPANWTTCAYFSITIFEV